MLTKLVILNILDYEVFHSYRIRLVSNNQYPSIICICT